MPGSLTVSQLDAIYWNQMAQLAAESVQLTPEKLGDNRSMRDALIEGNHFERTDPETGQRQDFGALRMTKTQATQFLDKYEILEAQPNTDSGFAGVILRDRGTGQITVAYRSTESRPAAYGGDAEHDIPTNQQIGDSGFAMAQIRDADSLLDRAAAYRQPGDPSIKLVGYSLSGNIVHTQAVTRPDLVTQATDLENANMAFNPTGLGNVGNGTHADVMETYKRVLTDPASASIDDLPYKFEDPRRQQMIDWQVDAIRTRNGAAPNPADGSPRGVYDDPAQHFALEYAHVVHKTSWNLNLLPGQDGVDPTAPPNVASVVGEAMTGPDARIVASMGRHSELTVAIPAPGTPFWVGPTGPAGFTLGNAMGKPMFDPNGDGANNHSLITGMDAVALAREIKRAMPDISDAELKEVFALSGNSRATVFEGNGSATGSEGDTLPKALTTLGKWYGVDMDITPDVTATGWSNYQLREVYHEKLSDLHTRIDATRGDRALNGDDLGHGYLRLDKLGPSDLDTLAGLDDDLGARVRFALANKSPYVITDVPRQTIDPTGQYDLANVPPPAQRKLVSGFLQTMEDNRLNRSSDAPPAAPGTDETQEAGSGRSTGDTAAHSTPSLETDPSPPTSTSPTLDENGQPLPEIGKASGLTDEQWQTIAAGLGERPGTLDASKATQLAANTHADTASDGDVTSGEEPAEPPRTTPDTTNAPVIAGEQTPAPVEAHAPTPVATDSGFSSINAATNLVLAIQHGNDLSATIAAVGLVNNVSRATGGGDVIPGEVGTGLGAVSSFLNLSDAIDRGDAGAIIVSGTNLASQGASLWSNYLANEGTQLVASGAASEGAAVLAESQAAGATAQTLGQWAGALGVAYSLANGDYTGAAISVVAYCVPVIGWILAIAAADGMFTDTPDTPTSVGDASAHWTDAGGIAAIKVIATRDEAGGGAPAQAWLNNLLGGLQGELATRTDDAGQPLYGLDPTRLPGIGYAFDPDTQAGYLRLSWTEADGTPQWRQYDTSGRRGDASSQAGSNDLVRDFFLHAADAIVPAWEAQTLFQQGADGQRPAAFTGELSADGATTTRTVLTLGSASATPSPTTARVDIDGDGYLEATQWTASPMLAIDLDGDGRITATDLVDGRDGSQAGNARNSLAALDANDDGIIDARDPAFVALRLWRDANGNGIADAGELGSLAEAGIDRLDGATLARQTLAGDTQGTVRAMTADGLYEKHEGGATTLLAINQHAFDNDPTHAHGGEANPDARGVTIVDAHDPRLQSTGDARPVTVQTHVRGDAALHDAGPGTVLRGQAPGRTLGDERTLEPVTTETEGEGQEGHDTAPDAIRIEAGDTRVVSNPRPAPPRTSNPILLSVPLAFVPGAGGSTGRAVREVTRDMIASADSGLFGGGTSNIAALSALAVSTLPIAAPGVAAASTAEAPSAHAGRSASTLADETLWTILAGSTKHADADHAGDIHAAPSTNVREPMPFVEATVMPAVPHAFAADAGHLPAAPVAPVPPAIAATHERLATAWVSTPAPARTAPPADLPAEPPAAHLQAGDLVSTPISPTSATPTPSTSPTPAPPHAPEPTNTATPTTATTPAEPTPHTPDTNSPPPETAGHAPDGAAPTAPITMSVFVNSAPIARGESATGDEDTAIVVAPADLLANDSDPDFLQRLSVSAPTNPRHGTVGWTSDYRVRFVPDADYNGPAGFDYVVSDGTGGASVARFELAVRPVNDAPVASGESTTGTEDTPLLIHPADLLANDTDVDGDPLAITAVDHARHGTVSIGADHDIHFAPDANYNGPASFEYTIADGAGGSAADAIRIRTGDARIISNPRPPSPPRTSNPILPIAASAALVFVPRRQTAAHFTQTKNRSGLAGFHIHLSAYIHHHITPSRRSRYHFPLSTKTRHQAGGGHPMAARRVA